MKVLVIGAAGKTGRAVVQKALEAGHEVTALVHSPGGVFPHGVDVRAGDACDPQTMDTAVAGQDAVIDTVGGKTPYRRTTLETTVATTVVAAMQRHSARRLVVTSSVGVGDSIANTPLPVRVIVATFLRGSTRDKAEMESAVRSSGLDWVITRPAVLSDKPATGDVHVLTADSGDRARALPRADLAAFLVAQLTNDDHLRTSVTLANR